VVRKGNTIDGVTAKLRIIGRIDGRRDGVKIGVLVAFAGRNCGGPEVFEREIVRSMADVAPHHEYHLYCLDRRARSVIGLPPGQVVYHQLSPSVRAVSMLTSLPLTLSRTRPDVLYAPIVPPPFCPERTIMTMPCSSLLRKPEFYPPLIRLRLRFLLHRAVRKAAQVVCPSKHVRDVVEESFDITAARLPVIHPGLSPIFHRPDAAETQAHVEGKLKLDFPFFLFSGRWEPRKNVVRTLEAFALFKRRFGTPHRLVFTGGRSWGASDAEAAIRRFALEDAVVNVGKGSLDELPYLYAGADALIYASLWEGFGMPIVEAMACGTPVITSNVSAMPETAGGNALLVDPYSVDEIANAMGRLATEPALGDRLRTAGLAHAQHFSWEKTARLTVDLCEQLA
jgi:glycosyltransferase involved in cell wall biosynthesis